MGSQWVTCTEDIFPANPAMGISTPRWIWDPDVYFETQICLKLLQVLEVVWMQHSAKSNNFVIVQGTWKQVLYLDIQVNDIQMLKEETLWNSTWIFFNFHPGFVCPVIESKASRYSKSMGFRFSPLKCQHKVKFCNHISSMLSANSNLQTTVGSLKKKIPLVYLPFVPV